MKTISAYDARINFGELLNTVYYKGEEIVIERKGKPMVKLIRVDAVQTNIKDPLIEAAGSWSDLDTDAIKKKLSKARRDESRKKQFLVSW